jgi:NhaA family Na+:H+ antiporter
MESGFVTFLRRNSIPLLLGVVAAVVFANVAPSAYATILHAGPPGGPSLHFLVNDVFMALFFGVAAKEITESTLPGGALNPLRRAVNPLLGTLGGVVGPALVFVAYCHLAGEPALLRGWGIPTATDIALAWLVARFAFGGAHPAVSFLLLLAVADDAIGLAIIAVFYPSPTDPVAPVYLGLVVLAMVIAYGLRRRETKSFWPYLLVPGSLSWVGLHLGHLHPALALVPIVPFMPSAKTDLGMYVEYENEVDRHDTLNEFEHAVKGVVDFGLFFFGLVNAGVAFTSVGPATHGVFLALALGKTVGITTASGLAHALGFSLPEGMDLRALFVASVVAALGLTVALFVAGVAFTDPVTQGAAKMGALGSALMGPIAVLLARLLRIERRH